MKIYIASSWKNESLVKKFSLLLRSWGHNVYCFAELGPGQHVFMWPDVISPDDDGITCLDTDDSRRAFAVDMKYLDWAEICILLLPCGRDAHLESGYIKGQGKVLFIIGPFPKGEYSNMYHLADGLYRFDNIGLNALRQDLDKAGLVASRPNSMSPEPASSLLSRNVDSPAQLELSGRTLRGVQP